MSRVGYRLVGIGWIVFGVIDAVPMLLGHILMPHWLTGFGLSLGGPETTLLLVIGVLAITFGVRLLLGDHGVVRPLLVLSVVVLLLDARIALLVGSSFSPNLLTGNRIDLGRATVPVVAGTVLLGLLTIGVLLLAPLGPPGHGNRRETRRPRRVPGDSGVAAESPGTRGPLAQRPLVLGRFVWDSELQWAGEAFLVDGVAIEPELVLSCEHAREIEWVDEETRAWFHSRFVTVGAHQPTRTLLASQTEKPAWSPRREHRHPQPPPGRRLNLDSGRGRSGANAAKFMFAAGIVLISAAIVLMWVLQGLFVQNMFGVGGPGMLAVEEFLANTSLTLFPVGILMTIVGWYLRNRQRRAEEA